MKKTGTWLLVWILMLALSAPTLAQERIELQARDYLAEQALVDKALIAEGEAGYAFESPLVVVNPYGETPLSALAIFRTDTEIGGTIVVQGKETQDDIRGTFPAATTHFVPIYGLYAGGTTQVLLTLDDGRSVTLEVETEPYTLNLSNLRATMFQADLYDYSALNICAIDHQNRCLAGFDSKGDLRWLYTNASPFGIRVLENGHLLIGSAFNGYFDLRTNGVRETDFLGKVYKEYVLPGGHHHDLLELPNGNLMCATSTLAVHSSMDRIAEMDRNTGEVVWELSLLDLVEPYEFLDLYSDNINGICYDEAHDTLIFSCRNRSTVFGVYKEKKQLAWILGDPTGWESLDDSLKLTPIGDHFEWQYGQHNPTLLSNGDILLFDNGYAQSGRTKSADVTPTEFYTRAVIYRVDAENKTVEQIWQYGKELGAQYYAAIQSGVQCLSEEDWAFFIDFGSCYTQDAQGNRIQCCYQQYIVDDALVWELYYEGDQTYRSSRIVPYEQGNNYDVTKVGAWFGDLGDTEAAAQTQIDSSAAQALPSGLIIDYVCYGALGLNGSVYMALDTLDSCNVVLVDDNGAALAYNAFASSVASEGGLLITVNRWISTKTLPSGNYDVFLEVNGALYDSGYFIAA